ncbi:MAG: radical SAM protein [Myxococcales bacterium]|nr:radical SAM protein [Myxococcales bacterium]MCB9716704.1 radical SAM protein [Myxococcales bacterium]
MSRRRLDVLGEPHPAYVVWELTLRCDHACTHCGSRAAVARDHELSPAEALAVVPQLAALGAREVVLIGGEAYLHPGFLELVRALAAAGVSPTMTTGGKGITPELARAMAEAGLVRVSVSIDGLAPTHDRMRASRGSFARATAALGHLREAGIRIAANTNLNRLNRDDLEPLYEHLRGQGIGSWQVQLTAPLGRAADRVDMILQPWDLLDLLPRIAALKLRARGDGIVLMPGNNLGYFGPEEGLLRSLHADGDDHFMGCQAGRFVMGIESDGAVKGCPSLQTRAYAGASVRGAELATIWREDPKVGALRSRTLEDLWGLCRECVFAETCMGGCSFTAHSILGRPGNDPYCHFRARTLAMRGLRERLVPVARAPGEPFDNGRFELVLEPLDAPDPGARLSAARRSSARDRVGLPVVREGEPGRGA